MGWLKWIGIIVVGLPVLALLAGQLGLLQGKAPANLGVRDGRLKRPSLTRNSVTSQAELWADHAQREYAHIAPLALRGDGPATLVHIKALVGQMPGAVVIESRPDYLYVQFTTRRMKFVDDVEFWFDPASNVVHVRSASRVGRKDFGANRARIETIRALLQAG